MNDHKCPICRGIGFHDGKICVCIPKERDDDGLEAIKSLFGDIFGDNGPKKGDCDKMRDKVTR